MKKHLMIALVPGLALMAYASTAQARSEILVTRLEGQIVAVLDNRLDNPDTKSEQARIHVAGDWCPKNRYRRR